MVSYVEDKTDASRVVVEKYSVIQFWQNLDRDPVSFGEVRLDPGACPVHPSFVHRYGGVNGAVDLASFLATLQ